MLYDLVEVEHLTLVYLSINIRILRIRLFAQGDGQAENNELRSKAIREVIAPKQKTLAIQPSIFDIHYSVFDICYLIIVGRIINLNVTYSLGLPNNPERI